MPPMPPMPPTLPPKLRIARWISIVGHPFVLSLLLAGFAAALVLPPGEAALVVALVGVGSIVPMILYLRREVRAGRSNFDVSVRRDRGPMFRFAFLLVSLVVGVLLFAGAPRSIVAGTAAVLVLLVAAAFCNLWLKVSLHAAFAAFTGVSLWNVSPWAGLVLVLAVAIGWSRVVLGRHTLPEVLAGAGLGIAVSVVLSVVLSRL
jgi:membrane-associated phospholipid phosphatase